MRLFLYLLISRKKLLIYCECAKSLSHSQPIGAFYGTYGFFSFQLYYSTLIDSINAMFPD